MKLPEIAPVSTIDDIESIDVDLSSLIERFIKPIDALRSKARPAPTSPGNKKDDAVTTYISNDFQDLKLDGNNPLESRTHAFYRMLGFPVIGSESNFYNPGFDPFGFKTLEKRKEINSKFEQDFAALKKLIQARETRAQEQLSVFQKQDLSSSLYALLLRYPMPFNVLNADKKSLEVDSQTFTVNDREVEGFIFASDNTNQQDQIIEYTNKFKNAQKILKPFIVEPRIENTVTPDLNKICVPFLKDKKACRLYSDNYLSRPGLELIIRQRLSSSGEDVNFLKDVENIISETKSAGVNASASDRQNIIDTLIALSDDNKITDSTRDIFTGITSLQVTVITGLIKTIKAVIRKLSQAMLVIDRAKSNIHWVPIPSTAGPFSGALQAGVSHSGLKTANNSLDIYITELRIKKLNAERRATTLEDLGEFASPFISNTNFESAKKYEEELQHLEQKRDRIAHEALVAMGEIEVITGEVSGLGLLDILAIYTALWSMETVNLINLLDTSSFLRMYNFNSEFRGNEDVTSRFEAEGANTVDISEVLDSFESKLGNILSFADKLLESQLTSPLEGSTGSID